VAGGIRENRRTGGGDSTNNRVERGGEGDDDKAQREGGEKPPPTIHPAVLKKRRGKVFFFSVVPLPNPRFFQPARRFPEPRISSFGIFVCVHPSHLSLCYIPSFGELERRDQGGVGLLPIS
jgi:hypothetical protein